MEKLVGPGWLFSWFSWLVGLWEAVSGLQEMQAVGVKEGQRAASFGINVLRIEAELAFSAEIPDPNRRPPRSLSCCLDFLLPS